MRLHILGICGTLMGSIALLAREQGHSVSGSDENVYPPMSTLLERSGITISAGYSKDAIPADVEMVIIGNANLKRGNPAVEALLSSRIPYTSGAEWLGNYLLRDRWVIAIAGTHGKTTTTSMVSWILEYAGLNPGFLIGGVPGNFSESSRLGESPFFVIEADEYDTSYFDRRSKFLHYRPQTLVMNNLEYDHADIFPDLDAIKAQFHLLLRTVPSNGLVIYPDEDEHIKDVLEQGCWTPTLPMGSEAKGTEEVQAEKLKEDGSEFLVRVNGIEQGRVAWSMTGDHSVSNGLAAIMAARHAGVKVSVSCEALNEFRGVARRMEVILEQDNLTVYDDFAHHPTAIKTTLEGLRASVGNDRVIAVIEPASHTMRLGTHENRLADSAAAADQVFWFQPESVRWDMEQVASVAQSVTSNMSQLLEDVTRAAKNAETKTHIVIMSNGAFSGFNQKLVSLLTAK